MTQKLACELLRRFEFHPEIATKEISKITVAEAIRANDYEEQLFDEMVESEVERELLSRPIEPEVIEDFNL